MNVIKAMGLDWLLEKDVWQRLDEHICNNIRYVVPGYKYNYRLCTFPGYIEFQRCETLDGELVNTDMHFSGNYPWRLEVSGAIDTASTAHFYTLVSRGGANIPVRVICPDVLPSIKRGDMLEGQAVAFAESVKKITEAESNGSVVADGNDTVTLNGCLTDVTYTDFSFEGKTVAFWELDVDTENGGITVVVPCDRIDFSPECGDYICARGVISMDVSIEQEYEEKMDRPCYEGSYEGVIDDADEVEYRNGFIPDFPNNQKNIIDCIEKGDYTRLMRCCRGTIDYMGIDWNEDYIQIFKDVITEAFELNLPKTIDGVEVKHLLSYYREWLVGHEVIVVKSNGKPHTVIHFDIDENGVISSLEFIKAEECELGLDHEFHLHAMLAEAMCEGKPYLLKDYLAPNCMYRSEYADRCVVGATNIIQRFEEINKNLKGKTAYTYRYALAKDELRGQGELARIYQGKHCTINYYNGELAYIVFLMHNEENKITNILLSCSAAYLKAFEESAVQICPIGQIKSIIDTLSTVYGSNDTIKAMRENELPAIDENEVYVWKKADEFALAWLRDNGYKVSETRLLEDCIGYACDRKDVKYAFFFYAYGEEKTSMLDGDYCAKLRNAEISKGRDIIVIYLHVDKTTNEAGEIEFTVESYGGKDHKIDPWLLTEAMGKSILRFYPRKEMMDIIPRLIAAFNAKDLDAIKVMCTQNVCLETYGRGGGRSLNDGFYSHLSSIREQHGVMKMSYMRFNDVVFSAAPYIDGYGYVSFSANADNKIECIQIHPLNNSYRELLISDEIITHSHANEVPRIVSVDFLPPSEVCRYSLRVVFENGEIKRYDLEGDFGDNAVTKYQYKVMTDKIFANGRVTDHIPMPDRLGYSHYAERGQGVEFINGTAISALELYYNGYPIEKFSYKGMDAFVRQSDYDESGFAVGYISHLDPQNPNYLLDKSTMTATVIPEKYQRTPIGIHPFYGGCSEGLVMVSEIGKPDLQYHHNRGPCAGLWGWLDTELNVVIAPKYVYAMNFCDGRAVVCKGEWSTKTTENGKEQYWCEKEQWGVIDRNENEIVPCRFDEIYEIDNTDRLYFVHEGGWANGHYAIYDVKENAVILVLDFDFDMGYMFNACTVTDDNVLVFDDHVPGEEKDLIYAYDLADKAWIAHGDELTGRTFNGETRAAVHKDGKDIIIF